MTSPDIHPEELLDKATEGTLDAVERVHLERHLAVCAVCRFETKVRSDFESIQVDTGQGDELVRRALEGGGAHVRRPRPARSWNRIVVGAFLVAGAGYAAVVNRVVLGGALQRLVGKAPAIEPALVVTNAQHPPAPAKKDTEAEQLEEFGLQSVTGGVQSLGSVAGDVQSLGSSPGAVAQVPVTSPDALLDQAAHLRRASKPLLAAQAYDILIERFPASREAAIGHVALGRMLFDSHDATGALQHFDAYLGSGEKDLEEEVLVLKAQACRRTGRAQEEVSALQALLAGHPKSLHAAAARARLSELSR